MPCIRRVVVREAALMLVASATAARAQLAGIPVYLNSLGHTGVGVAADVGATSGQGGINRGTAHGFSASVGVGPVTLTGMLGQWTRESFSAVSTRGADIAFTVYGGDRRSIAVSLQGGYGSVKDPAYSSLTEYTIPVGIALSFGSPRVSSWLMPHVQYQRTSGSVPGLYFSRATQGRLHLSAGLNLNSAIGLGVRGALDWGMNMETHVTGVLVGFGAHFHFRVPRT